MYAHNDDYDRVESNICPTNFPKELVELARLVIGQYSNGLLHRLLSKDHEYMNEASYLLLSSAVGQVNRTSQKP